MQELYTPAVGQESLNKYTIESSKEAQDHATQWLWLWLWLWTYNNDRPNMGIGASHPQ
jgi:putative transposase